MYRRVRELGIPLYITVDSLLHLYHVQFDSLLSNIEENLLFSDLVEMTRLLLEESSRLERALSGEAREAARRNVAYFSVAMKLLNPEFEPPPQVGSEVEKEVCQIEEHSGIALSPIFHYEEDYSQYAPRGHYTKSEVLRRYFEYGMGFSIFRSKHPLSPYSVLISLLAYAFMATLVVPLIVPGMAQFVTPAPLCMMTLYHTFNAIKGGGPRAEAALYPLLDYCVALASVLGIVVMDLKLLLGLLTRAVRPRRVAGYSFL